jgi:hypothetical protein
MHFIRISPLLFRRLLGVPEIQMVTTLGLVLGAMTKARHSPCERESDELADLILWKQNADGGWGYEFDVSLRWGSYKAGTSNLIATTFCAKALLAHRQAGAWTDGVSNFLESNFTDGYFGYAKPGDPLIHNANLLAASTFHLLGGSAEMVREAISKSVSLQNSDGSWFYGVDSRLDWIDNFHTAYVLESLLDLLKAGYEVSEATQLGFEFWQSRMFVAGRPKYFSTDTRVSADVNTLSSALSLSCHPFLNSLQMGDLKVSRIDLKAQLLAALENLPERSHSFRWDYGPAALALAQVENVFWE